MAYIQLELVQLALTFSRFPEKYQKEFLYINRELYHEYYEKLNIEERRKAGPMQKRYSENEMIEVKQQLIDLGIEKDRLKYYQSIILLLLVTVCIIGSFLRNI